jgi:hypothetical protein
MWNEIILIGAMILMGVAYFILLSPREVLEKVLKKLFGEPKGRK